MKSKSMDRYLSKSEGGKKVYDHRKIWEAAHGPIPKGYEIHHKDGNSKNNALENLMCMTHSAHKQLHADLKKEGRDVIDASDPLVIYARNRLKKYREENPDKVRASSARYRETHKEHLKQLYARWYQNNKEYWKAKTVKYAKENEEKVKATSLKYRAEHKEEKAAYDLNYRRTHQEKLRQYAITHRDLKNATRRLRNAIKRNADKDTINRYANEVKQEKEKLAICLKKSQI